jgi:hypothetical protein
MSGPPIGNSPDRTHHGRTVKAFYSDVRSRPVKPVLLESPTC